MDMIPKEIENKYFFHFTHIENLESILKNGFLSTNKKEALGFEHTNIANQSIQHRRSEMDVTCGPKGKVHDYVPFYFTTTNPMLLSLLKNKNVDQPFIIFFAISIKKVLESNVVFTNASANTSIPPNFYSDPSDLAELNWADIDKTSWGCSSDEERHNRMAEVLIYEQVPFDWIDNIIVFNEGMKDYTIETFKENNISLPKVSYQPYYGKYFYFCKFFFKNRKNETLVTGPVYLKMKFEMAIDEIVKSRATQSNHNFAFENIENALDKINENFCIIKELEGIYQLETTNRIHTENVSNHTKSVVRIVKENEYYNSLSPIDKNIVLISAYLHDIGKGPKTKWHDGKQPSYDDHPADAIRMLKRILVEDFKVLTDYEIRKICLLVGYHDLIGDILAGNRSKKEIIDLIDNENELNMLIAIGLADASSINSVWGITLNFDLPSFIQEIKEKIS